MKKYILLILICFLPVLLIQIKAQSKTSPLKKLYDEERYYEIVNKFSNKDKKALSSQELVYIGWSFYMLNDEERAKEYAYYAIQYDPNDSQLYYLLSLIYQSDNNQDEALAYAIKAMQQDSTKGDYYTVAGNIFLELDQASKAIEYYKQGISAKIPSQKAYYMLADAYDIMGQYKKALTAFYDAKEHTDKNSEQYLTILFTLGSLEMDNRQYAKAISEFTELIQYYPDDYATYVRLVQCCYALGDYEIGDSYKEKLYTAYQEGAFTDGEFADRFCTENFMVDKKLVSTYEYFQSVVSEDSTNTPLYIFYVVDELGTIQSEILYNYIVENGSSTYRLSVIRNDSSSTASVYFAEDIDYLELKKLVENTVRNGYVISEYTFK